MDKYIGYIIDLLIIFPIVTVIHEIGHIIAVKLFGGKITSVKLGRGSKLIKFGILQVNKYYFLGGSFSYSDMHNGNRIKKIIIMLSGPLLNIVSCMLFLFISIYFEPNFLIDDFIVISFIFFIVNLIPFSFDKYNTDGKQILDLVVKGESRWIKKEINSETASNTTSEQRSTSE